MKFDYTYDAAANRTAATAGSSTTTWTYPNPVNQAITQTQNGNSRTLSYDKNGSLRKNSRIPLSRGVASRSRCSSLSRVGIEPSRVNPIRLELDPIRPHGATA